MARSARPCVVIGGGDRAYIRGTFRRTAVRYCNQTMVARAYGQTSLTTDQYD